MKLLAGLMVMGMMPVGMAGTGELWVNPVGKVEVVHAPYGDACPEDMEELRGLDGLLWGCIVPYPGGGPRVPDIDCTSERLMGVLEELLKWVKDPNEAREGFKVEPAVYIHPLDPASELRHRADLIEQMSRAVREAGEVLRECRAETRREAVRVDTDADGTVNAEIEIIDLED